MARRSSSSRWSRPATGKQIAALKAYGNYDGKYYSVGRASKAIGRGSGVGSSRGSSYSSQTAPGVVPSRLISRLYGVSEDLVASLQPVFGHSIQSPLVASGNGPTNILSGLLDVPDDIDSLVAVALRATERENSRGEDEDDAVESVLYTIRSDDSNPEEARIIVETEVILDQAYRGQPSLQVRFIGNNNSQDFQSADPPTSTQSRPSLGYRPKWTPVLVQTPADLAEQMRVRWRDAFEELQHGVDPRMITFLTNASEMDAALSVLNSEQPPAAKFILLQGLMDPLGLIQYKGVSLDASTFAAQIRKASEGDEDALTWLEDVQHEEILTSFSEVTGTSLAAEADYKLSLWNKQAQALIRAATDESPQNFSTKRSLITLSAKTLTKRESRLSSSPEHLDSAHDHRIRHLEELYQQNFDDLEKRKAKTRSEYGILEDWFYEETQLFLEARFRQTLPGRFAAALTPSSADNSHHSSIRKEVRELIAATSTDPDDYSSTLIPMNRILQAVHQVIAAYETAEEEDLGTYIVAQEVLSYAQWKRDEHHAEKQIDEIEQYTRAAEQRKQQSLERAKRATSLQKETQEDNSRILDLESIVQGYSRALKQSLHSIHIEHPVTEAILSRAQIWLAQAEQRRTDAVSWEQAAQAHEQWANELAPQAATTDVATRLIIERDTAREEQQDAKSEQIAAENDYNAAQQHISLLAKAHTKFNELVRDLREENDQRIISETEQRRQVEAQRTEERLQRAEDQRKKSEQVLRRQEAENRRQEDFNQRQQDGANAAKSTLTSVLEEYLHLPTEVPFWRRKKHTEKKETLEKHILRLQAEIISPLAPPRTRTRVWPQLLTTQERYLGKVKKVTDYGVFVSLPAGTDGLLRISANAIIPEVGQLVVVEIIEMPNGKPIALKRV